MRDEGQDIRALGDFLVGRAVGMAPLRFDSNQRRVRAALRCLQFLRAPSVLLDRAEEERRAGRPANRLLGRLEERLPREAQLWLYRGALERGFLDALLRDYLLEPVLSLSKQLDQGQEALHGLLLRRRPPPTEASRASETEAEVLR